MTNSPDVTIVTPSYNQGEFIEETLQSVMHQDHDGVEHVVVDGGSNDETLSILNSYEQEYNLRWVSEPDDGQADAVNKGVEMADGEFVGWLNSDDIYVRRDAVSAAVEQFRETNADAVYGDSLVIDRDSNVLKVRTPPIEVRYERLIHDCVLTQPSVFLRREILRERPLDTDLAAAIDYDLWLRTAGEYRYEYIDYVIGGDRTHQERKTVNSSSVMAEENEMLRNRYKREDERQQISKINVLIEGLYLRAIATPTLLDVATDEDYILVDLGLRSLLSHLLFTQTRIENTF